MTLQTSGAISLSDIRGEFGGTAPDSLSEYYRGGGLVPDNAQNSGIPTSGAISLSDFYGASAQVIQVTGGGANDFTLSPAVATASISFQTDGNYVASPSGTGSDWGVPLVTGLGNSYQIMATLTSGPSPATGTLNTWLSLSSNRSWSQSSAGGFVSTSLSISIRDAITLEVIDTGTYNITVESSQ